MVAASMHELAVIVGPGAATRDLLPVYTDLIKDLDEVRIGALRILSRFLYVSFILFINNMYQFYFIH